ncbi:MAG: 5-deoxy-glucuronate isomerase [Deltaproteobacteria bacterium]
MSYPWNNEKKLDALKVSGGDDVLVFDGGNERAEVHLENGDIVRVVCEAKGVSTVIEKSARYHIVVGDGNAERDVYHFLKPGGPAPTLRLGITRHRGFGTWSSLPHPFELNPEKGFEEVFFYILTAGADMLKGIPKRAFQVGRGVWFDESPVDKVWPVSDHSWSTIPMGYHPVVGEPGVNVSYVWAYLAKKKEWEKV